MMPMSLPCSRYCAASRSTSVLLPAPGAPVIPITVGAGRLKGNRRLTSWLGGLESDPRWRVIARAERADIAGADVLDAPGIGLPENQ